MNERRTRCPMIPIPGLSGMNTRTAKRCLCSTYEMPSPNTRLAMPFVVPITSLLANHGGPARLPLMPREALPDTPNCAEANNGMLPNPNLPGAQQTNGGGHVRCGTQSWAAPTNLYRRASAALISDSHVPAPIPDGQVTRSTQVQPAVHLKPIAVHHLPDAYGMTARTTSGAIRVSIPKMNLPPNQTRAATWKLIPKRWLPLNTGGTDGHDG